MLKLWEVMRRCVRAGSFGCTLGVFHAGASSAQGCAKGGGLQGAGSCVWSEVVWGNGKVGVIRP